MKPAHLLWLALALSGCAMWTMTDPYGNVYGDWYNHGEQYRWALDGCEHEVVDRSIANPLRKRFVQCCMWRHGVPIEDPTGCSA